MARTKKNHFSYNSNNAQWFRASAIVAPKCWWLPLAVASVDYQCLAFVSTRLMCNPVRVQMCIFQLACLGLCYWWTLNPAPQTKTNQRWPIEGLNKIHKRDHEVWATENGGFIYNFITEAVCGRSQIILTSRKKSLSLDSRLLSPTLRAPGNLRVSGGACYFFNHVMTGPCGARVAKSPWFFSLSKMR